MKAKYPYKTKNDINKFLQSKIDGFLNEDEAQEIVKYMYSKEDANSILLTLKNKIKQPKFDRTDRRLTREERQNIKKEYEKKRVEFKIFEKVTLYYYLMI